MKILLTNDDGIHAEGLNALEAIACELSDDIFVCAPEYEQSGASRALTLSDPIRVRKLDDRRYAVTGTPTDCVMMAITELMDGARPDLVLSGVNHGANIAEDVTMSGTVAGAIEGMALGVPSMALSQGWGTTTLEDFFAPAKAFSAPIIRKLIAAGWPRDVILNLNFPSRPLDDITEVEVTRQTFRDLQLRRAVKRVDPRNKEYYWMGYDQTPSNPKPGTDLAALYAGKISITPLHIDLTHLETVHELRKVLGGTPPRRS